MSYRNVELQELDSYSGELSSEKRASLSRSQNVYVDDPSTDFETHDFNSESISDFPRVQDSERRLQLACKRVIDVVVSSLALIILSPVFLIVALLVVLESRGPAFFVQERWGRHGCKIRVFKFRTMHSHLCDAAGTVQATPGDSRVTRLGHLLRRSNIDELPQLLNVLRGDMSLIGPRCHAIGMLGGGVPYEELMSEYHRRHEMRPGITGLAQACGYRGPTVNPELARRRIELDLLYVRRFSLWLDVRITIRTVASEWRGGTGL